MHEEVEHLQHTVNEQLEQVMKHVQAGSKEDLSSLPKLPNMKSKGSKMSIEDK